MRRNRSKTWHLFLTWAFAMVMLAGMTAAASAATEGVHTHDTGEEPIIFEKWDSETSLPETAGNYVLTKDVTITRTWVVPPETTSLCMNGHSITFAGTNGSVIRIDSEHTLNVYDCGTGETHWKPDEYNYCWKKTSGISELVTSGGYITGGRNTSEPGTIPKGGGIYNEGTLHLYGGNVVGNCVGSPDYQDSARGGGIYNEAGGTVTIGKNVKIAGNSCMNAGERKQLRGGGICSQGTLRIEGSVCSNAVISQNSNALGGGVFCHVESDTVNEGFIDGNIAKSGPRFQSQAGGVFLNTGSRFINSGSISGNAACVGGGVMVSDASFDNTGTIGNNIASDRGAGLCTYSSGTITLKKGSLVTENLCNCDTEYGKLMPANDGGYGGGVFMTEYEDKVPTVNVETGAVIRDNKAVNGGAGIYINKGILNLSGEVTIDHNTLTGEAATRSNLLLANEQVAAVSGKLAATSSIGVGIREADPEDTKFVPASGIFTGGLSGKLPKGKSAPDIFTSDIADFCVGMNGSKAFLGTEEEVAYWNAKTAAQARKCTIRKASARKHRKGLVIWKKTSGVSGYLVACSTSRKFTGKTTRKVFVKAGLSRTTLKNLKTGRKYFVKVCPYKNVYNPYQMNKERVYGKWSKVKSFKAKR